MLISTHYRKRGYIQVVDEFGEGVKRQIWQISDDGVREYKILTDLLHVFLDNSTDYHAYIEAAQARMSTINRSMYPDN